MCVYRKDSIDKNLSSHLWFCLVTGKNMGIFAERAYYAYEGINRDANSLTAYLSSTSSWHVVITRENIMLKDTDIEIREKTGPNSWICRTPKERIWYKNKKDFPLYAVYLVPWTTYDDGDGTDGMIKMIDNKLDNKMTRISRLQYMRIHKFMSEFQYPFLPDIRKIENVFLFLHKSRFKRLNLEESIIRVALHPDRVKYYFDLGYGIDDWCDA